MNEASKTVAVAIGIAVLVVIGFVVLTYSFANIGSHREPLKVKTQQTK